LCWSIAGVAGDIGSGETFGFGCDVVEANSSNPDRNLRIGRFGFETSNSFSTRQANEVDLDPGLFLKQFEQSRGKRFFQRGIGTYGSSGCWSGGRRGCCFGSWSGCGFSTALGECRGNEHRHEQQCNQQFLHVFLLEM
jgi:hypothetical protein